MSGVVTAVEAEPGQVVAAGTPVVRIAQDGAARRGVRGAGRQGGGRCAPGSDVAVRLWAGSASSPGKVREVAASADPVTRTYPVKVALDAARRSRRWAPRSTVVPQALSHAGAPVIKLPTSALRQEGQGTRGVGARQGQTMTVRSQPVQVATADGNEAVIAAGLQPGMLVVSAGVHVLSPGQKVTIYQEKTSAAAGRRRAAAGRRRRRRAGRHPAATR